MIDRLTKSLDKIEAALIAVLSMTAILLITTEIIVRYLAPSHLKDWSYEVTVYLIGWALMLALPQLVSANRHVFADFILDKLHPRARRMLRILGLLGGLAFCLTIVVTGISMTTFSYQLDELSDSSLQFPMWIFYLSVPVGFGLSGLRYLLSLIETTLTTADPKQSDAVSQGH